jgi:hypothetical protein
MRALVLLALTLVGGCSTAADPCNGQPGACITARLVGAIALLDQVSVSVAPLGETFVSPNPPAPFKLPKEIAVVLPPTARGTVMLAVDGLLNGRAEGHGAATVVLPPNGLAHVTIQLGPIPSPGDDLAAPDDAMATDAMAADAMAADLADATPGLPALSVDQPSLDFSTVDIGATKAVTLRFTAGGTAATGLLTTAIAGAQAAQFSTPDDTCSGTILVPQATCSVTVRFTPVVAGPAAATVTVSSAAVLAQSSLSATGFQPTLTVSETGTGSGRVSSTAPDTAIGCGAQCSAPYADGTQVTLVPSPAANSSFTGWSGAGCSGTGPCMATVAGATAVSAAFDLKKVTLTVNIFYASNGIGTAGGTITGPLGFQCSTSSCALTSLDYGSTVHLVAVPVGTPLPLPQAPAPASGFGGWNNVCGANLQCDVTVNGDTSIGATFSPFDFMFVASSPPPSLNFGPTLASADAYCQSLAANVAAGSKVDPTGLYRAWLSTSTVDAWSRIKTPTGTLNARGFVNAKGLPVADFIETPLGSSFFDAPVLDEKGHVASYSVATGTDAFGNKIAGQMCNDWNATGTVEVGFPGDIDGGWTAGTGGANCTLKSTWLIYCLQVDFSTVLSPTIPVGGRRAFRSLTPFYPGVAFASNAVGLASADAICQADAASYGITNAPAFRALLAQPGVAALDSARFDTSLGTWYRLDGAPLVYSPTDLTSAGNALAALDQLADGSYGANNTVYTGAVFGAQFSPGSTTATNASTCTNWTSPSPAAHAGTGVDSALWSWSSPDYYNFFNQTTAPCNQGNYLYCLENK